MKCSWEQIVVESSTVGSLIMGVKWCKRCGTLKTGPHSEPGAYNYYSYRRPVPKPSAGNDAPWYDRLGYEYDEGKQDPECLRPEVADER